ETGPGGQRQTGLDRPNLVAGLGVERRHLPVIGAGEDARAVGRGTQAEPQALRLAADLATPHLVDDDRRLKLCELGGRLTLIFLPAATDERDGEQQRRADAERRDHSPSSGFGADDAASAGASAGSTATSGAPATGAASAVGVAPGRSESFISKNPRSRSSAPGATMASRYAVRAASVSPRAAWMSPLISAIRPA